MVESGIGDGCEFRLSHLPAAGDPETVAGLLPAPALAGAPDRETESEKKACSTLAGGPSIMKAQRELKKDRAARWSDEQIWKTNRNIGRAFDFEKQARFSAAGWPEIGVFALRTVLEESADTKPARAGAAVSRHGQAISSRSYNTIRQIDPLDAKAARLGKVPPPGPSMKMADDPG